MFNKDVFDGQQYKSQKLYRNDNALIRKQNVNSSLYHKLFADPLFIDKYNA